MLEQVLKDFVNAPTEGCVVNRWINQQTPEVQELLEQAKTKKDVNLHTLFKVMNKAAELPFKVTIFRMHIGGQCKCQ